MRKSKAVAFPHVLKDAIDHKLVDDSNSRRGQLAHCDVALKMPRSPGAQLDNGALAFQCLLPVRIIAASGPPIFDEVDFGLRLERVVACA